jgi:WD40 repeat protein
MSSAPKAGNKVENAHSDSIWCLAWSGSERILTGSLDGSVRIWNSRKLDAPLSTTAREHVGVNAMVATDDGTSAIVCYQNSTLRFFSINESTAALEERSSPLKNDLFGACTVSLSPDNDTYVTGTQQGQLHIRSLQSHLTNNARDASQARTHSSTTASAASHTSESSPLSTLDVLDSSHVLSTAFNDDGSLIAAACINGNVAVLDPTNAVNTHLHVVRAHSMPVRCVRFSPDGKLLYSASDDRHVAVYDTRSGKVVSSFSHTGMALSVDVSTDGRHFSVGSSDNQVYLWDLGMQRRECVYNTHTDQVWSVAYDRTNAAGRRFASGGDDALLQIYE